MKAKFRIIHAGAKELFRTNIKLKEENMNIEKEKNNLKQEHEQIVSKLENELVKKINNKSKGLRITEKKYEKN